MNGIWILIIIGLLAALIWGLGQQLGRGFPRKRKASDSDTQDNQDPTNHP